ncbi:MAG TPA: hypothetical protein VJ739_01775, partial [Gemmataceae bacterium]|nr:hypothetical protein [Gemmataceae bacterium]
MARILFPSALALLALLAPCRAGRAADDDDPEFKGHKTTEYVQLLHKLRATKPATKEDEQRLVQKRRVVLDVLELVGPVPRPVLPAVYQTLREDPSPVVRAYAAGWLGRAAPKCKQEGLDTRPVLDALLEALKA